MHQIKKKKSILKKSIN